MVAGRDQLTCGITITTFTQVSSFDNARAVSAG